MISVTASVRARLNMRCLFGTPRQNCCRAVRNAVKESVKVRVAWPVSPKTVRPIGPDETAEGRELRAHAVGPAGVQQRAIACPDRRGLGFRPPLFQSQNLQGRLDDMDGICVPIFRGDTDDMADGADARRFPGI